MSKQWEYKIWTIEADIGFLKVPGELDSKAAQAELNRLGGYGWELVSTLTTNMTDGMTRTVAFVLKRPLVTRD